MLHYREGYSAAIVRDTWRPANRFIVAFSFPVSYRDTNIYLSRHCNEKHATQIRIVIENRKRGTTVGKLASTKYRHLLLGKGGREEKREGNEEGEEARMSSSSLRAFQCLLLRFLLFPSFAHEYK